MQRINQMQSKIEVCLSDFPELDNGLFRVQGYRIVPFTPPLVYSDKLQKSVNKLLCIWTHWLSALLVYLSVNCLFSISISRHGETKMPPHVRLKSRWSLRIFTNLSLGSPSSVRGIHHNSEWSAGDDGTMVAVVPTFPLLYSGWETWLLKCRMSATTFCHCSSRKMTPMSPQKTVDLADCLQTDSVPHLLWINLKSLL